MALSRSIGVDSSMLILAAQYWGARNTDSIKKLQVKDVILNRVETKHKKGAVRFIAGCVLLTAITAAPGVFVGSMLMLSGYLGSVACFGAAIRNSTPADHVGLTQGIRIFCVVLVPMLVGPWIGSLVSASSGVIGVGVVGDDFTPSSLIFIAGASVSLLTFIVTWCIRVAEKTAKQ